MIFCILYFLYRQISHYEYRRTTTNKDEYSAENQHCIFFSSFPTTPLLSPVLVIFLCFICTSKIFHIRKGSFFFLKVKKVQTLGIWENDLFSCAVSRVRQPIESFFNWLNEKTKIQRAMKVRSTAGLLIHLFGKLSIAFINLIFKY